MSVLKLNSEPVRKEWLDAYGHLNEAYCQAERLGVRGACILGQPNSLDAKIAGIISP